MKHIVLLHGAIGATDQLEPLANALAQKQFSVHRFSFSGHGNTPFQEAFDIAQFAGELDQFIREHALEQPAVFGYSMGGYVALYLAKTKPQMLGTIMTLGTKFAWSPEIAAKEMKMLDADTILHKVPKFAEALKARHGGQWQTLAPENGGDDEGPWAEACPHRRGLIRHQPQRVDRAGRSR